MLNRVLCFLLVIIVMCGYFTVDVFSADLIVSAHSAVVMIADTRELVFSKNPYEKRGMASTTKIMSSIIALESGKIHQSTQATFNDVNVEGTSLGLKSGDKVSLLTLVKGMLLSSGNDAANVTATFVAGGKEPFARLMNEKAKTLGMNSTSFKNPSGLTEDGHYSTAFDMALLASYAVKNAVFTDICSKRSCSVTFGEEGPRTLYNHNKFLSMFDGALGIKTGFTKASGRCLVTAARRDGVTLVCVTLNASDDWNDHIKLMEYSFGKVKKISLNCNSPFVPVVGGDVSAVPTSFSREIIIPYVSDEPQVFVCYRVPDFLYAGFKKGDVIGTARVYINNKSVTDVPIVCTVGANVVTSVIHKSFLQRTKEFLSKGLSQRQT